MISSREWGHRPLPGLLIQSVKNRSQLPPWNDLLSNFSNRTTRTTKITQFVSSSMIKWWPSTKITKKTIQTMNLHWFRNNWTNFSQKPNETRGPWLLLKKPLSRKFTKLVDRLPSKVNSPSKWATTINWRRILIQILQYYHNITISNIVAGNKINSLTSHQPYRIRTQLQLPRSSIRTILRLCIHPYREE